MYDCFRALRDLLCKIWQMEATWALQGKKSTFTKWSPKSTCADVQTKFLCNVPGWYRTLEPHHFITRNKSEVPIFYQVWMQHLPAVPVVVVFLAALASSALQAGRRGRHGKRCARFVSATWQLSSSWIGSHSRFLSIPIVVYVASQFSDEIGWLSIRYAKRQFSEFASGQKPVQSV